ncbi:class I SAM-dependent methyltransferase [Halioxenophilus aromaticivorans]|uniref:Methyltransferase type 11 domain-containing protein n=1 Tax=Halioxenophilus aromaticivorans TaxID=1306992 RepID=A0AAV3U0A3_9ALTE
MKVLEIGGCSVPIKVANELMGAEKWVSVDLLNFTGGTYQFKNCEPYFKGREIFKVHEEIDWASNNIIIDGDALEFVRLHQLEQFDVIFSVNCFEHFPRLPDFLRHSVNVLKRGGLLFTQFGPIWSCCVGSHLRVNEELDFALEGLIDEHQHLLYGRKEMFEYLHAKGFSRDLCEIALYQIYNSVEINRFSYDDYEYFFNNSGYSKVEIKKSFSVPVVAERLALLGDRCPTITDFETYELTVVCEL